HRFRGAGAEAAEVERSGARVVDVTVEAQKQPRFARSRQSPFGRARFEARSVGRIGNESRQLRRRFGTLRVAHTYRQEKTQREGQDDGVPRRGAHEPPGAAKAASSREGGSPPRPSASNSPQPCLLAIGPGSEIRSVRLRDMASPPGGRARLAC